MNNKYGHHRLEVACERELSFGSVPRIRTITTILKNGQNKISPAVTQNETTTKSHGITRCTACDQKCGYHSFTMINHSTIESLIAMKLTAIF